MAESYGHNQPRDKPGSTGNLKLKLLLADEVTLHPDGRFSVRNAGADGWITPGPDISIDADILVLIEQDATDSGGNHTLSATFATANGSFSNTFDPIPFATKRGRGLIAEKLDLIGRLPLGDYVVRVAVDERWRASLALRIGNPPPLYGELHGTPPIR